MKSLYLLSIEALLRKFCEIKGPIICDKIDKCSLLPKLAIIKNNQILDDIMHYLIFSSIEGRRKVAIRKIKLKLVEYIIKYRIQYPELDKFLHIYIIRRVMYIKYMQQNISYPKTV